MPKGVYTRAPKQPHRYGGQWGLADHCFEVAGGDPIAALMLALDFQRIAAEPRWPLEKSGNRGPKAQEAADSLPSTDLTDLGACPLAGAPPGSLTEREAA